MPGRPELRGKLKRCAAGRQRVGDRNGMKNIQEPRLQLHQGTPETAGDLCRAESVRASQHGRPEHRVSWHRA